MTNEEQQSGEAKPSQRPPVRWLNRAVLGFGLASFFSDAGHEAASSALPALLAAFGAPPFALGIIEGVADGIASFAKLFGGFWSDRPERRKPIAVTGYLATGLSLGAYGLAASWPGVLVARSLGWLARGIRGPARSAMLADAVPPEALGRAFGFHRAADTAGAVAGPLLAMVLIATLPLRRVFFIAMIPGVLAAVTFAILVRKQPMRVRETRPFWHSLRALPGPFRRFLFAVFLFGLGDFARTLLILRATQLLTPGRGVTAAAGTAILLYALHNALYALASYPVGYIADRLSPRSLLAVGYGLGAVTALLAALATPSLAFLLLLFSVAGFTLAFADTLESTVTARLVDKDLRGTAFGVLATVNGIGDLLSSSLVGVVWTVIGAGAAFGGAAVLCGAGALIMIAGARRTP